MPINFLGRIIEYVLPINKIWSYNLYAILPILQFIFSFFFQFFFLKYILSHYQNLQNKSPKKVKKILSWELDLNSWPLAHQSSTLPPYHLISYKEWRKKYVFKVQFQYPNVAQRHLGKKVVGLNPTTPSKKNSAKLLKYHTFECWLCKIGVMYNIQ